MALDLNSIIEKHGLEMRDGLLISKDRLVLCIHIPSNNFELISVDSLSIAKSNNITVYSKPIPAPKEALPTTPQPTTLIMEVPPTPIKELEQAFKAIVPTKQTRRNKKSK
jgi:hypothetical protein